MNFNPERCQCQESEDISVAVLRVVVIHTDGTDSKVFYVNQFSSISNMRMDIDAGCRLPAGWDVVLCR